MCGGTEVIFIPYNEKTPNKLGYFYEKNPE